MIDDRQSERKNQIYSDPGGHAEHYACQIDEQEARWQRQRHTMASAASHCTSVPGEGAAEFAPRCDCEEASSFVPGYLFFPLDDALLLEFLFEVLSLDCAHKLRGPEFF